MKNIMELINEQVRNDPKNAVLESEKDYKKEIYSVAKHIADDDNIKIVSIAGPSSSGKTTTAHILKKMLVELGEEVTVISLDDFYFPPELLPFLSNGKQDIESVNALDVKLINKCFYELIKYGKTVMPRFDFERRQRIDNANSITLGKKGIVIVEGLHALNPVITEKIPKKNIYKIYISVNRPILDISGNQIISSRKVRLIRRILRDETFRNSNVNHTLSLWNDVVLAESKYLYCFKSEADIRLSTLHPYELCVYKERFSKLKELVKEDAPCFKYFNDAQNAIEKFVSLDASYVPDSSLLKEFIG